MPKRKSRRIDAKLHSTSVFMGSYGSIYSGDCCDIMSNLADEGTKVDLIFGSPPYEDVRSYKEDGVSKYLDMARPTDKWVRWMYDVYSMALPISYGLVAFVVGHGKGARRWSAAPALLEAALIEGGVILRRTLYYKRNGIFGSGGNDYFRADIERIIVAANNDERLHWSDVTACGHPPKYRPGGAPSHRNHNDERAKPRKYKPPKLVNPGDVIDCGAVGGGNMGSLLAHENEAPFPEKLAERMIRSFVPPGGVVLDPFCGSGTTLAVAVKLGRKFIGIDLRASQVELSKRRVEEAIQQKGIGL